MSDALTVTLCFDCKNPTPNLNNVMIFFLALKVEKLNLIEYIDNKITKRIINANVHLIRREINVETKDFRLNYEWEEEESNLISECAVEIRKHIKSENDQWFYFFSLGVQSGAFLEKNNEVHEEVKEKASDLIIYFYTEVTDVIHYKINFEDRLRKISKIQKLISIIEKELSVKVIKIGIDYTH